MSACVRSEPSACSHHCSAASARPSCTAVARVCPSTSASIISMDPRFSSWWLNVAKPLDWGSKLCGSWRHQGLVWVCSSNQLRLKCFAQRLRFLPGHLEVLPTARPPCRPHSLLRPRRSLSPNGAQCKFGEGLIDRACGVCGASPWKAHKCVVKCASPRREATPSMNVGRSVGVGGPVLTE